MMIKPTLDPEVLQRWIGRSKTTRSFIDVRSVDQMQSIIGYGQALSLGDELPKLWHWMYTFPLAPLDDLKEDGHPSNGEFMPPVALPRRMWAGGRIQFLEALKIGAQMECVSSIITVTVKQGRSGSLCFVTLLHEFSCDGQLCVSEEHDIVYKDEPKSGATLPIPPSAEREPSWSTQVSPSSVMLFRYSAATFNSHRIHYDREYAHAEGYPGLVFHGPLTTTLLLKELQQRNPERRIKQLNFKALSPLFDKASFSLNGVDIDDRGKATLWAANADGGLAIQATAELD
ncbi:MAG: 3-methylfumaryl-CoA hydratase [Parvicella sp.]|jgi:3-methylfumaryl-CoA hydratase